MKKLLVWLLFLVPAVLLLATLYSWWHRNEPVLFSYTLEADAVNSKIYSFFNPFRDREPEQAADHFLKLLSRGDFSILSKKLAEDGLHSKHIIEMESSHPISQWHLEHRQDKSAQCELTYLVQRKGETSQTDFEDFVVITLGYNGAGWVLSDYSPIY